MLSSAETGTLEISLALLVRENGRGERRHLILLAGRKWLGQSAELLRALAVQVAEEEQLGCQLTRPSRDFSFGGLGALGRLTGVGVVAAACLG